MKCKNCGTILEKGSNYCVYCGSKRDSKLTGTKLVLLVIVLILIAAIVVSITLTMKQREEKAVNAFMVDAEKCVSVLNDVAHNDYDFEYDGKYYLYYKPTSSYSFDTVLFPYEVINAEVCTVVPEEESYEYSEDHPGLIESKNYVEKVINYSSEEEVKEYLYGYMTEKMANSEFNDEMLFVDYDNTVYMKEEYQNANEGEYYDLSTLHYYKKDAEKRYVVVDYYFDYEYYCQYRITFKEYDGKWKMCYSTPLEDEVEYE